MNFDPNTVSTVVLGAALALSTLGARWSSKGRRYARERNKLREIVEDTIDHIHRLNLYIGELGGVKQEMPRTVKEYLKGDDDDV